MFGASTHIDVTAAGTKTQFEFGVFANSGSTWNVTNQGYIAATGSYSVAVAIIAAGTVTNDAGGTIVGYLNGVGIGAGGAVTNAGSITGLNGVTINGGVGTVVNSGQITSQTQDGVALNAGGSVSNSGTIAASSGTAEAIQISGGVGTVTNSGYISSQSGWTVELESGGSVTNAAGGTLNGSGGGAVEIGGGAASVVNAGTIVGKVELDSTGTVINQEGGSISRSAAGDAGVGLQAGGCIDNAGAIYGATLGVILNDGGSLSDDSTGTISGGLLGVVGGLANPGEPTGDRTFIYVAPRASIVAAAAASGDPAVGARVGASPSISGETGVYTAGPGDWLINAGSIVGTTSTSTTINGVTVTLGDGVDLVGAGAMAYNEYGGSISGARYGVRMAGTSASVTNAGAISGTTDSIVFAGSGANTLVLRAGSTLTGDVVGSTATGATNTLVLEGPNSPDQLAVAGTADNDFDNFAALVCDWADWTLGGASTIGATTVVGGALTVSGALTSAFTLSDGGALTFTVASDDAVAFHGAGSLTLQQAFTGAISDYADDDTIDLQNLQYNSSSSGYTVAAAGSGEYDVTVNEGSASASLVLASSTSPEGHLELVDDGSGGTEIEFVSIAASPGDSQTFDWNVAANVEGQYGAASSWTSVGISVAGPPTANDDAEIDVAGAEVGGTGVANELDFNAATTIDEGLTTTVATAAVVNAAVTVSCGWTNVGYLQIGGSAAGTLTVTGSGAYVDATWWPSFVIGEDSGATGTLNVDNGAEFSTDAGSISLGANTGANGVVDVSGAQSSMITTNGGVDVGAAGAGSITVSDGGELTTATTGGHDYVDLVGWNAGTTGSVTVTGAGSTWTSNAAFGIEIGGPGGDGSLNVEDGGYVQTAEGVTLGPTGTLTVDSDSALEVGTAGGAALGYITVDVGSILGGEGLAGVGTIDGDVVDNGRICAQAGDIWVGSTLPRSYTLTINGDVTGTGVLGIEEDSTLVLNGSVSSTVEVQFAGWFSTLAIGDAADFSSLTPLTNFSPGDTIDLTNVKYIPGESSWSFIYSPGGPDLAVTIGQATYDFNVPLGFDGHQLTLSPDASGNGTDIAFAGAPTTPFKLWSTLPSFFFTASGAVDRELWSTGNVADGGYPIWIQTETAASGYSASAAETYNVVMTSQDYLGDEQPMVNVATLTNLVDPFASANGGIGDLAAGVMFNSTTTTGAGATTGTGAIVYWGASTTVSGDYALYSLPITTDYVTTPAPTGENTTVDAGATPTTLIADVANPMSWNVAANETSSSAATEYVVEYTTQASATTENVYLQGFSTAGAPLTAEPILVASGVPDGSENFSVSYYSTYYGGNSSQVGFYLDYSEVNGSATGFYSQSLDPTNGALGTPTEYLSAPDFTSITSMSQSNILGDGAQLEFAEGFVGGQQVIQDFYANSAGGAITTFDLASATPDHWQIAPVAAPNDFNTDDTVLVYSDNNQVHLELLNESGQQVGADFIVPGLTSFDQIQTLSNGVDPYVSSRVEIDYTVADPNGGQQIESVIYDTAKMNSAYTLGFVGDGEYACSPYNNASIAYAPGVYTVNGGGGDDAVFFDTGFTASQLSITVDAYGDVVVDDGQGDVDTLQRFSTIQLADATIAIAGDTLTQTNDDGSKVVSTFNIAGQEYASKVISYAADGLIQSKLFDGVTGEGNLSSFEYFYGGGKLIGSDFFYTGITGHAYTGEQVDYNGGGALTQIALSGVTGTGYSSYEYDYVGGVFAGSQFTVTSVPAGASYSSYELDYNQANAFAGDKFFFANVTGQSYTGEEMDFDANTALSRVVLTGMQDQAYSSLELDYSAGTYEGYKAFYTLTAQSFTNEEVDVSASGQLEKVVYSGLSGTPYQTVEQDYSGGAPADVIYGFTDVTGQTYNAYQVTDDASGNPLAETFDLNSGGHSLFALASGQTLTSLGNDKMTGSSTGSTTFALNAIYGADVIANFTAADTISLSTSEFASFTALTNAAVQAGANVVITATDGDTLTLKNMTTSTLAGMSSNFTFHA
jgi:T5SS/PEP-CTERM-associated repeat protein